MDRVNGNPNSADYYNQIHQEDGQHASRPEAGQRFAGGPASGALGNHPAPGQPQPYHDFSTPTQIPPSPGTDWEYFGCPPQPEAGQAFAGVVAREASGSHLIPGQGESLYNRFCPNDKDRVDRALTDRGRVVTQRTAKDVPKFMDTLEPYGNGLSLQKCGNWSGLKRKETSYLTSEGGHTRKGKRQIENLRPDQRNDILDAITKRQRHIELNPQMPEPSWQWPEMLSPMPEMDPAHRMQMEAMRATTWQLTSQAVPGPLESPEPPIPYYDSDAVGTDFQHEYGSNGLLPQRAPERLIGQGIVRDMLVNIQGEVYRVHDMGSSVNPTHENPQGKKFMLVPRMRGG